MCVCVGGGGGGGRWYSVVEPLHTCMLMNVACQVEVTTGEQ